MSNPLWVRGGTEEFGPGLQLKVVWVSPADPRYAVVQIVEPRLEFAPAFRDEAMAQEETWSIPTDNEEGFGSLADAVEWAEAHIKEQTDDRK